MITRIRPTHWVAARLTLVALAATFVALMVSTIVRGRLGRGGAAPRAAAAQAPRVAARPLSDYLAISRRDLFAAVPANDGAAGGAPARATSGAFRLVGTGQHGSERYAVLEDNASKRQDVVGLGESIGGAKLIEVGWRRVVLRRGAEDEQLIVAPEPGAPVDPTKASAVIQPPPQTTGDDQVKKIGEDRYMVAQAEVDHSMENLNDLFTQLRAVPNTENGKPNGFRVFAIKRGSLFQKIGLENNDVVQRVNGVELNDPARAMALFQDLQGQAHLSVDIVRGGDPRTLSYEIR